MDLPLASEDAGDMVKQQPPGPQVTQAIEDPGLIKGTFMIFQHSFKRVIIITT